MLLFERDKNLSRRETPYPRHLLTYYANGNVLDLLLAIFLALLLSTFHHLIITHIGRGGDTS